MNQSEITELKLLFSNKEFSRVLSIINEQDLESLCPEALILKSRALLLDDSNTDCVFKEVEATLRQALLLAPDNPAVNIELGFFLSRIMADIVTARPFFEKALFIVSKQHLDALEGLTEIEEEQSGKDVSEIVREYLEDFELNCRLIK